MANPVGELEELIERALSADLGALTPKECAAYLAGVIAPEVVLRTQLEHVGWLDCEMDVANSDFWSVDKYADLIGPQWRSVFFVPQRVVTADAAHMVLGGAMGGEA